MSERTMPFVIIRRARAATRRSSLDLLTLRYPFSQVNLLTADEFVKEYERRYSSALCDQHRLDVAALEELHRHGVLVPLFRIDLTAADPQNRIDVSGSLTAQHVTNTVPAELFQAADEGRAYDPAVEPFAAWPAEHRRTLWPTVDSGYLYSQHQLLGLDAADSFVEQLVPERQEDKSIAWRLGNADLPTELQREALDSWRSLAITLTALDTYYWPQASHQVRHELAVWREVWAAFEPITMLDWLGLSLDDLDNQAMELRVMASGRDDLGDFYDVVRRASAEAWKSMRGDALAAMDRRLAADILDRYADDVQPGRPTYTPGLSQQGLRDRPRSLDWALTRLRLSPFPALLLAVEGATEFLLVPRLMELLGMRMDKGFIQLVDFGGSDKSTKSNKLALVARYAAEPVIGEDYGTWVVLDRPLTRLLVLTDAENCYATPEDRRYQRKLLLDSLTVNVPPNLRRDLYTDRKRDRIVEIKTWGKYPFEFAHFTDAKLADIMLGAAKVPYPKGRAALVNAIHMQRTLDPSPDVDDVFWKGSGLSKTVLAEALWPSLEARIKRNIEHGHEGPPIMQGVLRAYEMASVSYGVNMALRRHT
jgi:hypothetical protein